MQPIIAQMTYVQCNVRIYPFLCTLVGQFKLKMLLKSQEFLRVDADEFDT